MSIYAVALFLLTLSPNDAGQAHERAVLLHAQGLALAQDNDAVGALKSLREAHQLDPDDADITFDLARVALESKSPQLDADTADFMSKPATTADAKVLRAYILAIKDTEAAKVELQGALTLRPDHPEGLLARGMLDSLSAPPPPTPAQPKPQIWSARLRVFGEVDTNVQLSPQYTPSNLTGWRLGVQGAGSVTPLRNDVAKWDIAAIVNAAFHLNDRPALALYDTQGGSAWTTLTINNGMIIWATDLVANVIWAGERNPYFMQDYYLQTDLRIPISNFSFGVYGLAGYRLFGLENNPGSNDRTGGHYEAGVVGEGHWDKWQASVRSGFVAEQAAGVEQRVFGNRSVALVRFMPGPVAITALMAYEYRNYHDGSLSRVDNMFEPSLLVAYAINDMFQVVGSYLYVHDASINTYTYNRHVGMVGVEARW